MKDIYKSKKQLIKELEDLRRKASQGTTGTLAAPPVRTTADLLSDAPNYSQDKEAPLLIRKAIDSTTDAIGLLDPEGRHVYHNKAFTNLFEYTVEELGAAGGVSDAFAVKSIASEVFGAIMRGRPWSGEVEMRAKSGRLFSLFLRADAIEDDKGKIVGLVGVFTDISERKRLEYQLRKKNDELQLILDSIPAYVFYKDKDGKMLNINKAAMALAYAPKEKLLQKTVFDLVPETADKDNRDDMEVIRSGQPKTNIEESLELPSGIRWLKTDKLPIKDDEGNTVGLLGFSVDITDWKKAGEALRESEAKYRFLTEKTNDIVWTLDMDFNTTYVSPSVTRILGYTPEEPLVQLVKDQMTPESFERVLTLLTTELEREGKWGVDLDRKMVIEIEYYHKNGSTVWMENVVSVIRNDNGKPIGLHGVSRDISERKKAEEALRDSEEKLRLTFASMADGIVVTDTEGKIADINEAQLRMFGFKEKSEIIGKGGFDFLAVRDRSRALADMFKVYEKGVNTGATYTVVDRNGREFECELSMAMLHDATGKPSGTVAVMRDVTERRKTQEDIKRRARSVEALYGVAQVISQSSTLDAMLKDALGQVCAAMDTESGCVFMLDLDKNALKLKAVRGVPESAVRQFSTIALTEEGIEKIIELREPVTEIEIDKAYAVVDIEGVQRLTADMGRKGIAATPFFRGEDMQGLLVVFTNKDRIFSGEDRDLLKAIANEMSIGINNMMLLENTKKFSVTDELTGLYNRRYFFEMLDVEMNRSGRTTRPFSLAMLDLDGFKEYNDKYGHSNGDAVLEAFSQMLKTYIRKSDLAFRYGGDEFVLILPSADAEKAKKIIQRARAKWQKEPLTQSKIVRGNVGFSSGIAEYPSNAESPDGLIFLADAALYQAKKKGYEDKLVSELSTLSTDIMDVATQDQVYALAATVDARDPYTYGHSQRVAGIAMRIGRQIGMSSEDLTKLQNAAMLHDIGKIGVPDSILIKAGKPSAEEWEVIRKHCAEGARILSYVKEFSILVPIVLHHHEWYDGSGYPGGLKGIDIPSGARITSVADAYDTMVTKRPYRDAISSREACEELRRNAGTQFDPVIVEVWCKLVEKEGKKGE